MDLLQHLRQTCNFTYSLYVSLDSDYGGLERNNDTGKQEWTGRGGGHIKHPLYTISLFLLTEVIMNYVKCKELKQAQAQRMNSRLNISNIPKQV
jgi:hypothetical protein